MSKKKKFSSREFDEQFDAFLKDSLSSEDSINSARINKYLEKPAKKQNTPWWDQGDDEDDQLGKSKSFLKKKTSPSDSGDSTDYRKDGKQPPKPKARKEPKGRGKAEPTISKDSLDDISEKSEEDLLDAYSRPRVHLPEDSIDSVDTSDLIPHKSYPSKLGMDTMDELADKEKFFRELERNADSTVDYGRLNQELTATANTLSPEGAARNAATLAALRDIEDEEEDEINTPPRPSTRGEYIHSDRQDYDQSEQKPSMLSKVSLMDSLESTMNTTTSPHVGKGTLRDARDMLEERDEEYMDDDGEIGTQYRPGYSMPETLKTATGLIGTNTSQEIEALHKALEKVGLSATLGNDSQLEFSSHTDNKDTEDFVMKILNTSSAQTGKQRNVSEILKELEELQSKVGQDGPSAHRTDGQQYQDNTSPRSLERQRHVVEMEGEERGFALSPAQPYDHDYSQQSQRSHPSHQRGSEPGDSSHRGGFDSSHTEATEMYQPVTLVSEFSSDSRFSVNDRGRNMKKEPRKNKNTEKKKIVKEKQEDRQGTKRESSLQRSRSSSPLKIDFTDSMQYKFKGVKSSGYGQLSPPKPPRNPSRDKDRDIIGYPRNKLGQGSMRDQSASPARSASKTGKVEKSPSHRQDTQAHRQDTRATSNAAWSPAQVSRQKSKGSQSLKQAKLGTVGTTQLQASVESFAQYIKEHFSSREVNLPEMKFSTDEPAVSSSFKEKVEDVSSTDKHETIARLQGELDAMERSHERQLETQKLAYEQEIEQLKQQNFVLASKVSGDEERELKRKIVAGEQLDVVSKDQLTVLERELKEQETLISGYQQENKRLYNEMKNLQKQSKQTEERMYRENQKLLAEASNLRTQLDEKEDAYKNKGIITGLAAQQQIAAGNNAGVIENLETQLMQSKRTSDAVNREMTILQQSRVELEKHVEKLVMEREQLKQQIEAAKTLKSEEAQALEGKYEAEIERLKKKLRWYAENQELLEKGTKQLKAKDDVVHKLKMRIEELQTESGKRVEDSKVRAKERAADTKKIQDLQRQVKEMEQILKRRNPNSLPSLMIAAAAAQDMNPAGGNTRSAYSEVLEQRVTKLEKELEVKDGETDKLMRGVEQKYHSVKLQYEERIKELELQLSIYQGESEHAHPHTHSVALERELESVRERYKLQVKDLQLDVDRLTAQLAKSRKSADAATKAELQSSKDTETELRALVKSLQVEVESKDHDLQVIQKSLERLRKEKQLAFTADLGKSQKSAGRGGKGESSYDEYQSLPAQPAGEREYEPKVFEDTHISDVVKQNEDLKMKVDRLQLQHNQQRVDLRRALAESESLLRQTRENYEEKVESLRTSHQQEVKQILAQQALDHSTSRMAELQSKVDTQVVMIKHLREQQARLEVEAETASVLRIKQTRLEETIKGLHRDLKEAKKSHSPEMRHFEALQDKIISIETKHLQREQELQQIITNSKHSADMEIEQEVNKWRKLVETKNEEIQKFRLELDSILEVLRVLQKQGVIIPVSSTAVS